MKLILFVVAVLALVWLLRRSLGAVAKRHVGDKPVAPDAPPTMITCAQCGVHLPPNEALPGRGGVFCSEPHRSAYERAHPAP